jgi:lipopolysaccharide transport system permease protein
MQVNYPREVFLFKQTAQQLAQFIISFAMVLVVLLCFRVVPAWQTLLLPLVVLPLFLLAAAMGLIVAMLAVVAVDVRMIINMGMTLLMWVTPVVYVAPAESAFVRLVNKWNPLTYLVCSCRDIVIKGALYDVVGYSVCSSVALLLFLAAWRLFYVSESQLVERMI